MHSLENPLPGGVVRSDGRREAPGWVPPLLHNPPHRLMALPPPERGIPNSLCIV